MSVKKLRDEAKKKKLLLALERHNGIVYRACKEAGVSRNFFYNHYEKDFDFRASVDEINEKMKDFVEEKLYELISKGNERCIIFYLSKKAIDRGYGDMNNLLNNYINEVKIIHVKNENLKLEGDVENQ